MSRFRWNDPDETEGRRLYRALAEAQARQDIALTRKVRLLPDRMRTDSQPEQRPTGVTP